MYVCICIFKRLAAEMWFTMILGYQTQKKTRFHKLQDKWKLSPTMVCGFHHYWQGLAGNSWSTCVSIHRNVVTFMSNMTPNSWHLTPHDNSNQFQIPHTKCWCPAFCRAAVHITTSKHGCRRTRAMTWSWILQTMPPLSYLVHVPISCVSFKIKSYESFMNLHEQHGVNTVDLTNTNPSISFSISPCKLPHAPRLWTTQLTNSNLSNFLAWIIPRLLLDTNHIAII